MGGRIKYIFFVLCFLVVETTATETARHKRQLQPAPSEHAEAGKKVGAVRTSLITEASGIAASRKNRSVLWLHNDSGHAARLFAIKTDGTLLAAFNVNKAQCRDWEDIAIGPGPDPNKDYLYIGDIGDNFALHKSLIIYRIPEPKIEISKDYRDDSGDIATEITTDEAESIELVFPDGPKDAETLLVDPANGDIYIVTKREIFCRIYHAAYPQSTQTPTIMKKVAVIPWTLAVGGDISPDGSYIIIRSPAHASIWERPKGKPLWSAFSSEPRNIELVYEPQGEAICFDANGSGVFTVSEMKEPPIYHYAGLIESKSDTKQETK